MGTGSESASDRKYREEHDRFVAGRRESYRAEMARRSRVKATGDVPTAPSIADLEAQVAAQRATNARREAEIEAARAAADPLRPHLAAIRVEQLRREIVRTNTAAAEDARLIEAAAGRPADLEKIARLKIEGEGHGLSVGEAQVCRWLGMRPATYAALQDVRGMLASGEAVLEDGTKISRAELRARLGQ